MWRLILAAFLVVGCSGSVKDDEIGPMTVVGAKVERLNDSTLQLCIRYRAFGETEETCGVISPGEGGSDWINACSPVLEVGKPLPEECR